jgi:hypothetical protein
MQVLPLGFAVSFGILLIGISSILLVRRWRRDVEKKVRGKYFRENQGLLLEQLLSSDENATKKTKTFSNLEELEKATNNFDPTDPHVSLVKVDMEWFIKVSYLINGSWL